MCYYLVLFFIFLFFFYYFNFFFFFFFFFQAEDGIRDPKRDWSSDVCSSDLGRWTKQPHEYERGGTAKLLTLFRPATGHVRAKGVLSAPNAVLHPWLKEQLTEVLAEIEKKQRSEERRVGKECRWRWRADGEKR